MPDIIDLVDQTEYFIPNLTVHKLRTFKTCKRQYLFQHILRLRPAERPVSYKMSVGSAYAAGLQVYRTTEGDLPAAMFTAAREYILQTGVTDYRKMYNPSLLVNMLQAYDTAWPYWADYRPFMYPNGELGVENEFQTTLEVSFDKHELIYSTKPDAIYISPEDKIIIVDDKSGYGGGRESQNSAYELDMQMCMYLHCARENGIPAHAIEIRNCRYLASGVHCYPDPINISNKIVDETVQLVNYIAEQLTRSDCFELYADYAANYHCTTCPYLDICRFGRWSEDQFEIKEKSER